MTALLDSCHASEGWHPVFCHADRVSASIRVKLAEDSARWIPAYAGMTKTEGGTR